MTRRYGSKRRTKADKNGALMAMLSMRATLDFTPEQARSSARSHGLSEPEFLKKVEEAKQRRAQAEAQMRKLAQ